MQFTQSKKDELLAFIDSLEPSVDTAPLVARIVELEAEVAILIAKIDAAKAALA